MNGGYRRRDEARDLGMEYKHFVVVLEESMKRLVVCCDGTRRYCTESVGVKLM